MNNHVYSTLHARKKKQNRDQRPWLRKVKCMYTILKGLHHVHIPIYLDLWKYLSRMSVHHCQSQAFLMVCLLHEPLHKTLSLPHMKWPWVHGAGEIT